MSRNTFCLEPVPPFRLDLTVWTLRRRPDNAVDRRDGRTYRRVLVLAGIRVEVAVTQIKPPEEPQLPVTVEGASLTGTVRAAVTSALERLLGLHIDLAAFHRSVALTLARWKDYGGLIYFHLLLDRLAEAGHREGGLRCFI